MTFAAPLLGLAALASWLPILWLHRRRREAPIALVPSLAPWLALVAPPVPRRRRIRATWLLAIHLAIAASLAAAVARPAALSLGPPAGALALVMDATTSMAAGTRWSDAEALALAAIDTARGPFTLVSLGAEPRLVLARARASTEARAAVARLQPVGAGGDVEAAIGLARAAAGPAARLVVVTDGGVAGVVPPDAAVVVTAGGDGGANAAVLDAASTRDPERGEARVTARVANFAAEARDIPVTLLVDGERADQQVVALGPRESRTLAWRARPDGQVAEVRLAAGDALAMDDVALAWLPGRPLAVQVVGASGPVARALAADAELAVEEAGPATLRADGAADVTVVVSTPLGRLPPGGILWVAPEASDDTAAPPTERRVVSGGDHPLVAGLDLADALLGGLTVLEAPGWAEPILMAGDRVAAYAGVRDGRRHVVLAFDPALGDIAQRVGFPLLVRRAIRWLAAPALGASTPPLGSRVALLAPADVEGPGRDRVRNARGFEVDRPGLYRLYRAAGAPIAFAVNAGDARESDLSLRLLTARDAARPSGAAAGAGRPLWRAFAVLALLLAAAEAAWRGSPPRSTVRR